MSGAFPFFPNSAQDPVSGSAALADSLHMLPLISSFVKGFLQKIPHFLEGFCPRAFVRIMRTNAQSVEKVLQNFPLQRQTKFESFSVGAHPRVVSLAPSGQFTFCTWRKIPLRLRSVRVVRLRRTRSARSLPAKICRKAPKGIFDSQKCLFPAGKMAADLCQRIPRVQAALFPARQISQAYHAAEPPIFHHRKPPDLRSAH